MLHNLPVFCKLTNRGMTSKQRVLNALARRVDDRIPITFDAEPEVYAALHRRLGTSAKAELFDRLHVDTWMILPGNFIYTAAELPKTEKTALWGYRTTRAVYAGGAYDELSFSPLAGKDELRDIRNHPWPGDQLVLLLQRDSDGNPVSQYDARKIGNIARLRVDDLIARIQHGTQRQIDGFASANRNDRFILGGIVQIIAAFQI